MDYLVSYQVDYIPHVKYGLIADSDTDAITQTTKRLMARFKKLTDGDATIKTMAYHIYAEYHVQHDPDLPPVLEEHEIFYGGFKPHTT